MPVLAHHDLGTITGPREFDQIVGANLIRLVSQQPDPVKTNIGSTINNAAVIVGVRVSAAVTNQTTMCRNTARTERGLLFGPRMTVLRVRYDRNVGGLLRDAGSIQELHFERRDVGCACRDFNGTGANSGRSDAVGDFADI